MTGTYRSPSLALWHENSSYFLKNITFLSQLLQAGVNYLAVIMGIDQIHRSSARHSKLNIKCRAYSINAVKYFSCKYFHQMFVEVHLSYALLSHIDWQSEWKLPLRGRNTCLNCRQQNFQTFSPHQSPHHGDWWGELTTSTKTMFDKTTFYNYYALFYILSYYYIIYIYIYITILVITIR